MGREIALSTLYSLVFNGVLYSHTGAVDFPTLNEEEEKSLDIETAMFARYLIMGTLEHLSEIDSVISRYSINRPLDRIDIIDRNVLRMSVFSILYDKDIHSSVVITEAVRLSQESSREVNYKFNNGILDYLVKERA
jgi:N utilization substance protein B